MTNLLTVIPELNVQPFAHILPSLEKALISTSDLLTLDALDVAKIAHVPTEEVRKLIDEVVLRLNTSVEDCFISEVENNHVISLLDDDLDEKLNGGIHSGFLTEVSGESAVGKTQFLMTLLLSTQLKDKQGQQRGALYISTEAKLPTHRLAQILKTHPKLAELDVEGRPSLSRIQSTQIRDLESQEHVLRYQVPVIVQRHNIGLLVIDSIAANYRAEFDKGQAKRSAESFARRSLQIQRLGSHLRELARTLRIAIVVANQVADRFDSFGTGLNQLTQRSHPGSPRRGTNAVPILSPEISTGNGYIDHIPSTDDVLAADHQQRFFSGWGDDPTESSLKNPSLGLTWTNQLATRIVLLKRPVYGEDVKIPGEDKTVIGWQRRMKLVFSGWCASDMASFEIWEGGIRSMLGHKDTAAVSAMEDKA